MLVALDICGGAFHREFTDLTLVIAKIVSRYDAVCRVCSHNGEQIVLILRLKVDVFNQCRSCQDNLDSDMSDGACGVSQCEDNIGTLSTGSPEGTLADSHWIICRCVRRRYIKIV